MQFTEKLSYLGVVLPNLTLLPPSWTSRNQPRHFPAADGLFAHWHDAWPEDPQIALSWDVLVRSRPSATTFHTPAWQQALARPYIRAGRFRMLTIGDGKELCGVLPLQLNPGGVMETLGSMISDYTEPLVADERAAAVWMSLCFALCHVPGIEVKQVSLHNIRKEHIHFDILASSAKQNGFAVEAEETAMAGRVPLAATWDQYLATLGGHDRKEIRRKLRNAQTKANAQLVVATSEHDVAPALDQVFSYMRQAGGAKGIKAQWTYRPMFKRAAGPLARAGRLKVYTLRLEGRDAAGLICFPGKDGPMLWAAGYDNAFCKWSPGIVLFALAIQHAIGEGATFFDLLRGQQRYKSELGAVDTPVYRVTLKRT